MYVCVCLGQDASHFLIGGSCLTILHRSAHPCLIGRMVHGLCLEGHRGPSAAAVERWERGTGRKVEENLKGRKMSLISGPFFFSLTCCRAARCRKLSIFLLNILFNVVLDRLLLHKCLCGHGNVAALPAGGFYHWHIRTSGFERAHVIFHWPCR